MNFFVWTLDRFSESDERCWVWLTRNQRCVQRDNKGILVGKCEGVEPK